MTLKLRKALGEFYTNHVSKGEPKSVAVIGLRALMQDDPASKEAAEKRLDELTKLDASTGGNLAKRCYVSHVQKTALQEALA